MGFLKRTVPVFALLGATLAACSDSGSAIPATKNAQHVDGEVIVHRDGMGVPHIYGNTAQEVLYGAGYALAEDRLFQVFYRCRLGKGRGAELLGNDYVETDKWMRTRSYSEAEWQAMIDALPEAHQLLLQANLAGINAYIAEALEVPAERMPYEFAALGIELTPLTLTDLAAGLAYMFGYYAGGGGYELQNLEMWTDLVAKHGEAHARIIFDDILVLDDPDAYTNVPYEEAIAAEPDSGRPASIGTADISELSPAVVSNLARNRLAQRAAHQQSGLTTGASRAIVIGPERSASGNVLMMQATADGVDVHVSGGGFEAAGLAIPPLSIPIMGRTDTFGWLITTGENDMADIYEEQLDPENRHHYRFNGEWRDMEVRTETIEVAGGEPQQIEVARTLHGPVVEWDVENNRAYSLKSVLWKNELTGWSASIERARAKTLEEFERAVKADTKESWNIVYGDVAGHIEYWHTGGVPIRAPGADPRLPLPGTGEFEWTGFREPEDWPTAANPAQGYLHAWNSKPSRQTRYGDMSRWGKHFRTYLPKALIEADDSITFDELQQFNRIIGAGYASMDLTVTTPDFFEPHLIAAAAESADGTLREAVALIAEWDGGYEDLDSDGYYDHVGLTLFRKWLPVAERLLFEDEIGDWWYRFDEEIYVKYRTSVLLRALEGETAGAPMRWDFFNGEDKNVFLLRSLQQTLAELADDYGTNDLRAWHHERFKRTFATYDPTILLAQSLGHIPTEVPHNGMPSWTTVMEIDKSPPMMLSLVPSGGQSRFVNLDGEANPHIADQVMRHLNFDMKTVWLGEEEVLTNTVSTKVLRVH